MWIGANDIQQTNVFAWIDGSSFSYRNWELGQPNLSPKKLCVASKDRSSGLWSTVDCGDELCFICESYNYGTTSRSSTTDQMHSQTNTWSTTVTTSHATSTASTPGSCLRDIVLLIDTSTGLGLVANFQAEVNFIGSILVANWLVGPTHVEAVPVVYDIYSFDQFGTFTYQSTAELQKAIANIASTPYFLDDPPSIFYGLNNTRYISGRRSGVAQTLILFTSTSNQNDINQALPIANQLKSNGSTIIVVALGPNADPNALAQLSSGAGYTFSASDYNSLATNFALGSQMNQVIGATCSPYSCWQDIYLMIDTSKGLGLLQNFQAQMAFIASTLITNWNVSPGGVEAEVFLYDSKLPLNEHGAFDFKSTLDLKNLIINWDTYFLQDNPSITVAFQAVINNNGNNQRAGAKPVTLLFTSSSDSFDISQARPLTDQLKSIGHTIVIVAMGTNVDVNQLIALSSGPGYVFQANNYTALRTDSVLAANINQAIGICTGSTRLSGKTTTV
uniref:Uncharacterized protein n=1 Tax=Plectus sambesii TaxID=2011161 RepID=A0A914XC30_9BILA